MAQEVPTGCSWLSIYGEGVSVRYEDNHEGVGLEQWKTEEDKKTRRKRKDKAEVGDVRVKR